MENTTHRGLQAIENAKRAIWTTIEELNEERRRARGDRRKELSQRIEALLDELTKLRGGQLRMLDDSPQVIGLIEAINAGSAELEREARLVNNVAKAIEKGADLVSKAAGVAGKVVKLFA
jgi:hypothetical protein